MMSSKMLFLGVYSEDGLLRRLFLPTCYVFMFTPFTLLAFRYIKFFRTLLDYIPNDYTTPDIWPQIFISLITVFLATRLISGSRNGSSKIAGKRRVQLLPFWVPGVRHWWNVVFGGEGWLKSVRDTSITDIFAFNYCGAKHNIVLSAPLLDRILANTNSLEEADFSKWTILRNAFGIPKYTKAQYLELRPLVLETLESELFKGEQLKKLSSTFLRTISEALPDLITFNSSIVDQFPWERVAEIELTDGTDEAECNLFTLINEFFCRAIIPIVTGPQFPDSYELLATDLAVFNQYFYRLSLGLPRLFPLPGLPSAMYAKKRLIQNLDRLFDELMSPRVKRDIPDDESISGDDEETDADTPTPLTALNDLFTKHDLPRNARSAITLELLHRIASKAIPLAFWTIVHIYGQSTPKTGEEQETTTLETPLVKIRQETKTWAEAVQPPSIHPSFPAPPEISFSSLSPLFNPSALKYLRSCIFESNRMYSSSIKTAKISKPIIFTETTPAGEEEWQLDVGSYVDIGLSQRLINTSGAEYFVPDQYKPDRTSTSQAPSPLSASLFDDSEEFVTATLIALVAGITQLWEIDAAPKKGIWEQMQEAQVAALDQNPANQPAKRRKTGVWVVPKAVDGAGVMVPKDDVRVRIRRREGLEGPKSLQKRR